MARQATEYSYIRAQSELIPNNVRPNYMHQQLMVEDVDGFKDTKD